MSCPQRAQALQRGLIIGAQPLNESGAQVWQQCAGGICRMYTHMCGNIAKWSKPDMPAWTSHFPHIHA